jgi:hypothetical protein
MTVLGPGTSRNEQNPAGPDATSIPSPGNHLNGIRLDGSDNNQIGGPNAADRNVISGNVEAGVLIDASNNNVVNDNLIGLNAAGTAALPNGQDGVWINNGSTGNAVGSGTVGQTQYIAGNAGSGFLIMNSDGNNVYRSSRIGVDVNGAPLGNGDVGVLVIDSSNSLIYPLVVANNGGAGVGLTGNSSLGNDLGPTHVGSNAGLPMDLGLDGPTPNDGNPDIGPNNFLDYPVITATAGHVITGTACADCTIYVYQAVGNPAAPGGGDYLSFTLASASGNWSYSLPGSLTRVDVTLQARDLAFNTSEFSPRPILFLPLVRR